MEKPNLAIVLVAATLALILIAVIGAMLIGLFDSRVDNTEVFKILGPAFQTVVGAFVGVLSSSFVKKGD